jgi:uncharacterized protein
MIHPDFEVRHTHKGLGLFAKRRFRMGEILWITDDLDVKLPLDTYLRMEAPQKRKVNIYCYLDDQKRVVIPWDEGKYVNHSCAPNSTGLLQFDNVSVALREIEAGEELVEDYHSYSGHFESFECACEAASCRGYVQCHNSYDASLRLDLRHIVEAMLAVPQPLLELDTSETRSLLALMHRLSQSREGTASYA